MTRYDRASVAVGVILVGTILALVLELPVRAFTVNALGTPLTLRVTGVHVLTLLLVGMACAGTEAIMRLHPLVRRGEARHTFTAWILPALATLAMTLVLPQSPDLVSWVAGLVTGGAVIAWLMLVHDQLLGTPTAEAGGLYTGKSLVAQMLALVLFVTIYGTRVRSLVTATAVTAVAFGVSLSLLGDVSRGLREPLLYAAVVGLLMGQTTWALNYWRANALTVGVLLMLIFYVLVGIAREHLRRTLDRRAVIEFLGVAAIGIWIAVRFAPGR
jgi:hypothetical protein